MSLTLLRVEIVGSKLEVYGMDTQVAKGKSGLENKIKRNRKEELRLQKVLKELKTLSCDEILYVELQICDMDVGVKEIQLVLGKEKLKHKEDNHAIKSRHILVEVGQVNMWCPSFQLR